MSASPESCEVNHGEEKPSLKWQADKATSGNQFS